MRKWASLLLLLLLLSSCTGRLYSHYGYVSRRGEVANPASHKKPVKVSGVIHSRQPSLKIAVAGTIHRFSPSIATQPREKAITVAAQSLPPKSVTKSYSHKIIEQNPAEKEETRRSTLKTIVLGGISLAGVGAVIYLAPFFFPLSAVFSLVSVPFLLPIELLLLAGLWYSVRNYNLTKKENPHHLNYSVALTGIVVLCTALILVNALQICLVISAALMAIKLKSLAYFFVRIFSL